MAEEQEAVLNEAAAVAAKPSLRAGLRSFLSWRTLLAAGSAGVVCGLIGAVFTWMLSAVEHAAFGFSTGTFAEAVTRIPAHHRFLTVCIAGPVVAAAWYFLRKRGPAIPSVAGLYAGKRIGFGWMAADTTLQVLNVALGGSIGREGAPRQAGALAAADVGKRLGLGEKPLRVLVACAAGAGLAAIYNVPFGGTIFALEIMIGLRVLWAAKKDALVITLWALAISWLATLVARIAIPDRPAYQIAWQGLDASLVLMALLAGPLVGTLGFYFGELVSRVSALAPKGRSILWAMPVCYLLLALLAIPFPLILGNGHALAENLLREDVPLGMAALLVFAKPVATLLTVRAGATGGKLTPSLSTGAALGTVLAAGCAMFLPVHVAMVAVLGAGAFLAGSLRAPLTAGVLALELTGADLAVWPLVALAVAGTWATNLGLARLARRRTQTLPPQCLE